jgi:formylglycine-generating enzyme required for sulfatase activity
MKKKILLFAAILGLAVSAEANNVITNNVSLSGQNTASDFTLINYDIAWENSWRTSTNESNHDGVWIFCKFRKKNTSAWQHATINYVAPGDAVACGHLAPAGSTIKTSADGKGVWMYRDANGQGNVNWAGANLRWNYGADNVLDSDSVEMRLFAVEMVNVPAGNYYLGSGGIEINRFRKGSIDTFFEVTSENAITIGSGATHLTSSLASSMVNGSLPAAYPKGYKAFWMMKYEASKQQYVDFLNTMDLAGATARNVGGFAGVHPNFTAANPERVLGGTGSDDVLAFLDWAAMRPMTELEFEKACRGKNILPVANEYAWGNTTIAQLATPTLQGTTDETWATGNANYFNASIGVPIRCGAIATATSNRTQSGGTYYGIMEMTGNVAESVVTANTDGRTFVGAHGDGYLSNTYMHNEVTWTINALGYRGAGAYSNSTPNELRVSDRTAIGATSARNPFYGIRAVRSAE